MPKLTALLAGFMLVAIPVLSQPNLQTAVITAAESENSIDPAEMTEDRGRNAIPMHEESPGTSDATLGSHIFGHNIFSNSNLTFEPALNLATPVDYKLGPGDEIIIDVWGENQTSIHSTISPDGSIFISGLGPVYLNGMTIDGANKHLQREFARIYSGIEGSNSEIRITLGQIRTIQINVMGEAVAPGTYALSSFANAFYALYRSGGVNRIGSLRNIQVMRDNKRVSRIDIYEYILNGKTDFIKLEEGDVVVVPTYDNLVRISGEVKRPMYYELKNGESLQRLLSYSGGFTGEAFTKTVRVERYNGIEKQIYNIDADDYAKFILQDADVITVGSALDRFENKVNITGAVYRPGGYEMNTSVNTLSKLIERAEGLRDDAFPNRALLTRQKDDLSLELIPIDLAGLMSGRVPDIDLKRNDNLHIPSIFDLSQNKTVTVHGPVGDPGTYTYIDNMTLEDLIVKAGGLRESASTSKVDVARRIKNNSSIYEGQEISEVYTISIKDGLVVGGDNDFLLQPFDEIYIRRSPGYEQQQNVIITGEIMFPGTYALTVKNERLTDLIEKSGGLTESAYIRGARLERTLNEDEIKMQRTALRMAKGPDSLAVATLDLSHTVTVGIDLEKALLNPESDWNMTLREGDRLIIPQYVSTVKVNGAVLHSNTVLFQQGMNLAYYINQAGGYMSTAKRSKVFVVHLNGQVTRYKKKTDIKPGSEIFVPSKPQRQRLSMAEVLAIGTTATSLGTLGVAISNLK